MKIDAKKLKSFSTPMLDVDQYDNGLTYSKVKKIVLTEDIWREHERIMREKLKGQKIKNLVDASESMAYHRDYRKEFDEIIKDFCKAVAVFSKTPLGNTVANLYLALTKPVVPMKLFSSFELAEEWLLDID